MDNAKILLVDDDQDFVSATQANLEGENYTVITANDRTEGMEKIKSEKPDLAIFDVMMTTWEDGFEMAREVKKDPELKNTPILMLTAIKNITGMNFKTTAGDPDWCPVDGFLDKPVDFDILLDKVRSLLG